MKKNWGLERKEMNKRGMQQAKKNMHLNLIQFLLMFWGSRIPMALEE